MKLWLNGEWSNDAISAGALSGWGVFTTLGVWNGKAFAVEAHLARLRRDALRADVPHESDDETLEYAVNETIARNAVTRGAARITVLRRGDGRWNNASGSDIAVLAKSTPEIRRTFRLALSPFRVEARRPLAGIKATSYLDYQMAAREAQHRGFDDAILCNSSGALCECSRANLFWARGETLYTPSLESGCLPGIARALILEWAQERGIAVREGIFSPHELASADEIFVSASTLGACAVSAVRFDESHQIECAAPGALTQRFSECWREAVE